MPSIQGNHTVQILPRQREVSIQDNWEVDKYIVLANGQVSPSSLSLSVSHSGFTNPLYEWRKYNPQRRTWESINKTSKTISIAPQEEWGNDGFKIGCLVKERDKNGDEGVFAYKPFTRRYLDSVSDDTSSGVDSNIWSKFVSGELSELNIVCSNPNGFKFPEDVGNRLTAGRVSILMHIGWGQNWHPSNWFTNNEIKNADMRVLIPKYVRVFTSDGIEIEGTSVQGNSTHYSYKAKPAWGNGEKGEANSATYEFLFISDGLRRKSYCIWLNRIETRGLEVQERAISDLKKDPDFLSKVSGAGVRANLWKKEGVFFPNSVQINKTKCEKVGDGIYRITKGEPFINYMYSEYTAKLLDEPTNKAWVCSFRILRSSRPVTSIFAQSTDKIGEKGGRFYIVCNAKREIAECRGVFKVFAQSGNLFVEGDWVEFGDYKVELVDEGEPLEPTSYIPHVEDLRGADGISPKPIDVAREIDTSVFRGFISDKLAKNQAFILATKGEKGDPGNDGVSPSALAVANEMNTASFREGLANAVVTDVTTNQGNLAKIRKGMVVETTYNKDKQKTDKRVGDIEMDIAKFAFVEVSTYSSEWRDYTDNEYVGGGHKPDPWGGGGIDGYIRTVHNYELYRSVQNLPPKYIEQSKKVLRDKEYKIGDKFHRDAAASIIYDMQDISGIDVGSARCWEIFTSPYVTSILRYGRNTRMANPNMQGQQKGSGANAYWNVYLEKGANYRIFANNDGSGKYRLYVVKNGAY